VLVSAPRTTRKVTSSAYSRPPEARKEDANLRPARDRASTPILHNFLECFVGLPSNSNWHRKGSVTRMRYDEPRFVGGDYGLRAIAQPQFVEDAADMSLYRFLGDDESLCDLDVG
jgi:hypothetical protein